MKEKEERKKYLTLLIQNGCDKIKDKQNDH